MKKDLIIPLRGQRYWYNPVFSSLRLYHFRDEPTYMLVVISALKHKDQPNRNQMVQHEIMRMTWYKFKIPKAPLLWNPISNPTINFRGEGPPHSPHSHLWKCKGFMKSWIHRPMAATRQQLDITLFSKRNLVFGPKALWSGTKSLC